jgi:predicted permease
LLTSTFQDIRYGLKLHWKEKGFTVTALLTLALCIGANTTIFSVIDAVLLKPLPFEANDRLVEVHNSYPNAGAPVASAASGDYFFRRERIDAFEAIGMFHGWAHTVGEAGSPEQVNTMRVTPSFLPMLGVQPVLGRQFSDEEMDPGNEFKVILGYGCWQDRFHGASDVLGREMRIDGRSYTIVGVLPEDFRIFEERDVLFYVPIPIDLDDRGLESLHSNNYQMWARLRPGATVDLARNQIDALNTSLTEQSPIPNGKQILDDAGFHTEVHPLQAWLIREFRPMLIMLWAGVLFVLLIGTLNIANLMLARANTRLRELATRAALGAGRLRLSRQLLTESVTLAVLGGGLGLALAAVGLRFMETLGANDLPRSARIVLDGRVLGFTLLMALVVGVLFGLLPLWQVFRTDLTSVFRQEGRTGTSGRGAVLLRSLLVGSQVAVAFLLLIGAGLMFSSFRQVLRVEPGFEPAQLLTGRLMLPSTRYADADSRRQFAARVLEEVRALPGVERAALTDLLPFTSDNSSSVIVPEGYEIRPGESILSPYRTSASADYFEALGIPLREGRTFEPGDQVGSEPVIVIDEWLAQRYWPDGDALGKRMYQGVPGMPVTEIVYLTIVGVVGTVRVNDLTESVGQGPGAYYFDIPQRAPGFLNLVVKTRTEPATLTNAVRERITSVDPDLPIFDVETMQARIEDSLRARRSPMMLLGVFALLALFLAAVGIYGVLAYVVTQRTREIGIRMALGSGPDRLFRMVLGQGIRVLLAGMVVGLGGALALSRLLRSQLYGVEPTAPGVYLVVAVVLGLVALLACALPARRATRIDPVKALMTE